MKLILGIVCLGATAFMLRIFAAFLKELRSPTEGLRLYFTKFIPLKKRGELIVMNPEIRKSKFPGEARRAAFLFAAIFILISCVRAQESSAQVPASAKEVQELRDLIRQLQAKVDRLENGQQKPAAASGNAVASASTVPSASSAATGDQPGQAEALTSGDSVPGASPKPQKAEPFAFADWTWLNGNPRTKEPAFDSKFFTPEVRADVAYHYDFNHPKDDTIGGSSEVFRSNEISLTHLGVGGDFHYDHVRARIFTQLGLYSTATPRNDASYSRGQWQLDNAYRYLNEAYGGYHFDALHGINVDAGIFLSYVGLFSFYQFDNWAYQPSFVSSNTPWFFTGLRVQVFPTEKLKIEPWIINGWQSYARPNGRMGLGGQILYRPTPWLSIIANNYGVGADAVGIPNRTRYHTDDSVEVKYYDRPERFLGKMAFSFTADAGCESGGGVACTTNKKDAAGNIIAYKQSFLGFMLYNRWWFHKDRYAFTLGGGKINNPGRYLVLLPPINGATATTGTSYFTESPGDQFKAWDMSGTYDYMPSQYITFRWEFNHRHANVPYWSGPGGVTPPGGNQGTPGSEVSGWFPDLRKTEDRASMAILVKF